jgi:hypothetical protein
MEPLDPLDALPADLRLMVMHQPLDDERVTIRKALGVRGASRELLLKTDADMCLAVGHTLAAMLPCVDPHAAGRALARQFTRGRPAGTRAVGWKAALDFITLIRLCCRHGGVVAGSAALFLERACIERACVERASADQPAWIPNDVDCFLDDKECIAPLLQALGARGLSREITIDRAGTRYSMTYPGRWPPDQFVSTAAPTTEGIVDSVIYGLMVGDTALQLIIQQIAPDFPAANVQACDCHLVPNTGCRACMHFSVPDPNDGYVSVWPARAPHTRFDLDGVCVAIRRADGAAGAADGPLEINRLCGAGPPTMTLRPQAVWSVDGNGAHQLHPPATLERMIRRVNRYVTRGFNRVVIPREFHLRLDPPVTLAVPELVHDLMVEYLSFSPVAVTVEWG